MSELQECCHYQRLLNNVENISIIASEKISENHSSFIVYIIKFMENEVRRRYSEFESLQVNLAKLYPTLLIPPIPNKHTLAQYATKQNKAKDDIIMIEKRKRMLQSFLNRILNHPILVKEHIFHRFLDRDTNWNEVVNNLPISDSLKNISIKLNGESIENEELNTDDEESNIDQNKQNDVHFSNAERFTVQVQNVLSGPLSKVEKGLTKKLSECSKDLAELGALYNGFSLTESEQLAQAIEKVGQATDISYMSMGELSQIMEPIFSEPLEEYLKYSEMVNKALRFRKQKQVQLDSIKQLLNKKKEMVKQLELGEQESKRLAATLQREIEARDPYSDDDSLYPEDELKAHPNLPHKARSRSNSYLSTNSNYNVTNSIVTSNNITNTENGNTNNSNGTNNEGNDNNENNVKVTEEAILANNNRTSGSGGNLLNLLSYTFHGLIDVDPEASRRNNISKTKEQIIYHEEQLKSSEVELKNTNYLLQQDLNRFQQQKTLDFNSMLLNIAKQHVQWCQSNLEAWNEAYLEAQTIPANRKVQIYNSNLPPANHD